MSSPPVPTNADPTEETVDLGEESDDYDDNFGDEEEEVSHNQEEDESDDDSEDEGDEVAVCLQSNLSKDTPLIATCILS
jgi:hypothetical protein